jgi:hypothetical protein
MTHYKCAQTRVAQETKASILLTLLVVVSTLLFSSCAGYTSAKPEGSGTGTTLTISNLSPAAETATTATIVWQTNLASTSEVQYGATTAYGSSTSMDSTMVQAHQQTLTSLTPSTLYHFRVVSTDSSNNTATSADATLTTAANSTPPTVSITAPANGATVSASVSVLATASGSNGITSVQFLLDGANLGAAVSVAPYATSWDTTQVANGQHVLAAVAKDSAGNSTISAAVTVNVNNSSAPLIVSQPVSETVIAGQTAAFTVLASGSAPLSYQWSKNGTAIAGAAAATYTTPATTVADSGSVFTVTVSNGTLPNATSTGAVLTVTPSTAPPTITTEPQSQTVTSGQTATFFVAATGAAPLAYQWQKNGANIAGATSQVYTTPATTTTDNGAVFTVTVSNGTLPNATSNPATLTVNAALVAPSITSQPVSQTVTAGETATFTVVATGAAPLAYQWQKNGVNINGANAATYTTPATTLADSGSVFTVSISNGTPPNAFSATAILTVNAATVAPQITTQPLSQTVTAGQAATFTVFATGTAPLAYQWQKNGANISGATGTSYVTPATVATDSGSIFTVVVSNGTLPNATSLPATLTVTAASVAPTITAQPQSDTVTAGETATFTVVASGTAPLSYQWQKNGANIAGAVTSTYTTPATATADNGTIFTVTVSNGTLPNATSLPATLTVNAAPTPPTITTQPANQSVTAGQTATFTVVATGTAPLAYQWQKNGTAIAGATAASYTTPATATTDNGAIFTVTVSNGTLPNATSNGATLTVTAASVAPSITTQPVGQTVTAGQTATFTVVATGTAPLAYQWQKNGANIAGANAATYTTPVTTTADSGSTFTVTVSNGTLPSPTSVAATLTVNAPTVAPTITTQPANQSVTAGQTATFTVVAAGTAPLAYQWQKNGANIAGATAASYTTSATTAADNGSTFTVTVSNGTLPNAVSTAATLTVTAATVAPSITTQPVSQVVTAGQTATFTVVATGTAPLAYQWQKNGAAIAGATAASYTTPATATTDSGSIFTVTVSNGTLPNATSVAATLTVNPAPVAPTITTQPVSQTVTAGQTATFTVVATGTAPLAYQWQKNGAAIAGATAATYTTPGTSTSDNGSVFTVIVSNGTLPNATSTGATLTVNAPPAAPSITSQPQSQTVIAGQTATFTVVATGTAPLAYQWQKNGAAIAGATAANYTTPVTTTADSGSVFTVLVSNGVLPNATSVAATLTVNPVPIAPTITTQPASQTVTTGQTATFTVVATGTAPLAYQWQKNGASIAGANAASYTTPATATTDNGSVFTVIVSNGVLPNAASAAATLTVNPATVAPKITTQPVGQTVTAGQTATFTVVATGTAPLAYQWQKNGAAIAGATAASYTTPATTIADSGSSFTVTVSNGTSPNATSSGATLTVNPAPAPVISVSVTSINFGSSVVGSTVSQPVIVSNTGNAALTISAVSATGSGFSVNGFTLPITVNAGKQTTITAAFDPTAAGAATGSISITSNAPTSPTAIALSGTGTASTLTLGISPTSLSFGNVLDTTTSTAQTVTITNTGNASVTISSVTATGTGFSITGFGSQTTLTPTQQLVLSVTFTPATAGAVTGSISVVSNATGSPATVTLSGTGQHWVALSWSASSTSGVTYNVYRSTTSGNGFAVINSSPVTTLSYSDSNVQAGTTYFYQVTAVDSGGESVPSNQVSVSVPTP